ncbi:MULTISPECIES: hypothetical protein [Bifidobacterium]|uniref:hypothetical protein n=1 Tax=Bifidobacterium TaxID=1678 RepID=UPI0011C120A2|nr:MULTISPECIES: hypothetical protein [Bifidobacterium]
MREMQQCFMFIDTGNGWTPVNDSTKDVAALDSFTIDWGSDGIDEQPEPAVMSFTLRDRTGRLAGQALTLAGMKVVVQFSNQPRWMDLSPTLGRWSDLRIPLATLHKTYSPDSPDSPDSPATTIFAGTVSTGGSVEPSGDAWLISLSATSLMAVWKRLQSQGPTDAGSKWDGAHWIGTPADRLKELNRRAAAQGAPEAHLDGLPLPSSVAPYTASEHPSQLDLLHRLAAGPRLPQWHETYSGATSSLHPLCLTDQIAVHLTTDGKLSVLTNGETRKALDAGDIIASTSLTITEPITQVVINAKRVKSNNGKLSFDDIEITMGDQNRLPPQLTVTQKSHTLDSDMLAVDESGGVWNSGPVSTVSDTDRTNIAEWLETHDLRMVPKTVTFDSRRIDPARFPWAYVASPSGAFLIAKAKASILVGSDGRPAFTGPVMTIGGTLRYRWSAGTPTLTQEATITPLRPLLARQPTWSDLAKSTLEWRQIDMHICDLSMIQTID